MDTLSTQSVAVFGECMLEVNAAETDFNALSIPALLGYGGDTLNTAVYMARLGASVEFVSALGDDLMSDWLIAQWEREGVGCRHVARLEGQPGLYLIELDPLGERSFRYWRDGSPASRVLDLADSAAKVYAALSGSDYLFLSGISLAILKPGARNTLIKFLASYRKQGGKVIFDCNHRPALWSDPHEAKACYWAVYKQCDIALSTFEDEQGLFGYDKPAEALDGIVMLGVPEVVLKLGERGCVYSVDHDAGKVPGNPVDVIDTTSAGDSFNAAYIASRLAGNTVPESCVAGHRLASTVIQHKGAIIRRELMPTSVQRQSLRAAPSLS